MKKYYISRHEDLNDHSPCTFTPCVIFIPIGNHPMFKIMDKRKAKKEIRKIKDKHITSFPQESYLIEKE